MTQVKRTPRLYSENYNHPNVKSVRSEKNKRAWLVYSDRAENKTKEYPGGTLDHTELGFMEPLLVIGKKGDYYKLIKYKPEILDNNRLKNYKEAEFCGWLHKSRLLLFDNSISEIRNKTKLKNLTAIKGSHIITESHKYIKNDSLILYAQPNLKEATGTHMALNSVVYIFKLNDEDSKALIAYQPEITPETARSAIIGWVDSELTAPMGQRLVMNTAPRVKNEVKSRSINGDSLRPITSPLKSFYPILFADKNKQTLSYRSLDAGHVIDRSKNRIYNVNGEIISFSKSITIAKDLANINVIFAFDFTKNVVDQMPMLTNIIQNLKQVFERLSPELNFHFAAALGEQIIPFDNNYLNFSDLLIEKAKNVTVSQNQDSNKTLSKALDVAEKMPNATNLIVYIGEKSGHTEYSSHTIINRFITNNARLLSYQVYAENNNMYNNFVLQSASIIEAYADTIRTIKRNIIVNPDRLCKINRFKENIKNTYTLDYPKYSMTQGMVIFPEKNQAPETGLLTSAIDSIVSQIKHDNLKLIADMDKAFLQVGSHRNQYDNSFANRFGISPETKVNPKLSESFKQVSPQWVAITHRISSPIDTPLINKLELLFTEQEINDLEEFIVQLSEEKPDLKGEQKTPLGKVYKERKLRKQLLQIPTDTQLEVKHSSTPDSLHIEKEYVNTRSIRRHLKKTYLVELKKHIKKGRSQTLSLAQAQEYITGMPSLSLTLSNITIKDLSKKNKFTDEDLNELILYFETFKEEIGKQKKPVEELNGNGCINYYTLPTLALP